MANECDGNQVLENISATLTQKRIGDFFSGGNSAKQAKTQQSGETDCEKQSADAKARKSYAKKNQTDWLQKPQFHWLFYDNATKKKLMTCSIYIQHKKINAMTLGTENFRIIYTSNHFDN